MDYDGKRLLLGIQTEGLATTFRRGQHAELVRQALSEVLGVEAVVEAVSTPKSAEPGPATAGPATAGPAHTAPMTAAASEGPVPVAGAPGAISAPDRLTTPRQRARAAVAREASTRHTGASSSAADDSLVSPDDEDIDETEAVGQPVIARVLGGTVIGELDQ